MYYIYEYNIFYAINKTTVLWIWKFLLQLDMERLGSVNGFCSQQSTNTHIAEV